ncbi:MAG: hypothetical protein L0Y72_31810 [Gemmataceae bacterium]|nr:hypothetical protein [Gemmataceae bacterium]MCI0743640.1 hypothetical protein [Gemmataceae bacterium]
MLSEQELELLTAFVDGDMSRRQRKAVLRLLHRSSEARAVLRDLQENVHRLMELPKRKVGEDLAPAVLQTIEVRGLKPTPPQLVLRRRVPIWARYAVAASILLLGAGLAYYLISRSGDNGELVAKGDKIKSQSFAFQELAKADKRDLLARELRKERAVHLDLKVRDNASAVQRLRDVFGEKGVDVLVDEQAKSSLAKLERKVQYFVYAENLSPEEVQAILHKLGAEEAESQWHNFQSVAVASLSAEHKTNISSLLGVKEADFFMGRVEESNLFDQTVIEAPKGKGKKAPAIQAAPQRLAVVLASTGEGGAPSQEVRQFLASRQQLRPGTMQVLLVLNQTV